MNVKVLIAVAVLALAAVFAAVILMPGDTPEEQESQDIGAVVWLDLQDGSDPVLADASGSDLRGLVADALSGHNVEFRSNGSVKSVDGIENTDGRAWTVFKWASPKGWAAVTDYSVPLDDGVNLSVSYSHVHRDDGAVTYDKPDIDVEYKVYFYFQMKEKFDATEWIRALPLSESEKREGVWISGVGSNANEAFADAVLKRFFPDSSVEIVRGEDGGIGYVDYVVDGKPGFYRYGERPDMYGWFKFFLGWEDTPVPGTQSWTYWMQYNYNPDAKTLDDPRHWDDNDLAFGLHDITKYRHFAVIMMTSVPDPTDLEIDLPAPSEIPPGL